MQIKELNEQLGITKDNLRYYEKEGLISPARKANGYRDYSDEDIESLKKILVLRRLAVPINDIRDVLEDRKELEAVLDENIRRLDEQISRFRDAKKLCEEMEKKHLTITGMDPDEYLQKTSVNEGKGFADITKDVITYSMDLFTDSFGHFQFFFPVFKPLLWKRKKKGSAVIAAVMCILLILSGGSAFVSAAARNNYPDRPYFLIGAGVFTLIIVIWIILRNIVYFLSLKYEKHQKAVVVTGSVLAALVSLCLAFASLLRVSHAVMFSPYKGTAVFRSGNTDSVLVRKDDEIPNEDNVYTPSYLSTYYNVTEQGYIDDLKNAVLASQATGQWSLTANDISLRTAMKLTDNDTGFYQIILQDGDNDQNTFFYLYKDGEDWILDEPYYGLYHADDSVVRLVREYSEHVSVLPGVIDLFREIFEYDPERVWHEDGRYDTYRYLILTDRETGEDVTWQFIETWKDSWQAEDWDTLIKAYEGVQVSIRTEYVHSGNAE